MTEAWVTIGVLAVATIAIKAGPPLLLGGRPLPERLTAVIALLAPALLAALVLVGTVGGDREVSVDARLAGLAAAGGVLAARRSLIAAVVAAAAVTALVRAV